MSLLAAALSSSARMRPTSPALADGRAVLSYGELDSQVSTVAEQWQGLGLRSLALLADNSIAWAVADLAAHVAGLPLVPVPLFFSPQQMQHALRDSAVDALLTDRPDAARALLAQMGMLPTDEVASAGLTLMRLPVNVALQSRLPPGTAKVTYTSGTTGEPKGVCLSRAHLEQVAQALLEATGADDRDRHLCLTPLSTLLENIGGVHVPLLAGAVSYVLPLAQVGLSGASGLDPGRMVGALRETRATSAIVAPQMLQALVTVIEHDGERLPDLRFVAVGGAPVSPHLLDRAQALHVPVFEGYGLSECASVVALNRPGERKPGTVGKPLPHVRLRFGDDGEVFVEDSGFLGYLGQGAPTEPWATGDLGTLDEDGFLRLHGRKKSLYITSFGRNLAPEWVESELTASPVIAQAALFGDGRACNVALLTPMHGASDAAVGQAIDDANARLPDYARVRRWARASAPFTPSNQQLTSNGRLRREAIADANASQLESLYQEELNAVF